MGRSTIVAGCTAWVLAASAAGAQSDEFARGRTAYLDAKYEQSVDLLEHAVAANSGVAEYWDWLGRAYCARAEQVALFSRMKLAHRCRGAFDRAVVLDSTNLVARADQIDFYAQAPGSGGGDKARARRLATALQVYAPYAGGQAVIKVCQVDNDRACWRRETDRLLAAFPDSDAGYVNLALYYEEAKQFDSAFALLDRRLASHPNDWGSLYQLGRAGAVSGWQLDRAGDALKKYLGSPAARDPEQKDRLVAAHYRLGMVYAAAGHGDSARAEYGRALVIDPENAIAKKALRDAH